MCGVDSYTILRSSSLGCGIFCYFEINLVLSKLDLVCIVIPYFYEIYFNMILLSVRRSSKFFCIFRFSHHIFYASCISRLGSTKESAETFDPKSKCTHSVENLATPHCTELESCVTSVLPFKKGVYAITK
jgi:hypothetical protein